MRRLGFLIFIVALIMGHHGIAVLGFLIYEFTGITWIAAITSGNKGASNNDHGSAN